MKTSREIRGPRWAAAAVLNSQLDVIGDVEIENEKRAELFQDQLPVPRLDVVKMVSQVKQLTEEIFNERQRALGDGWFGSVQEWQAEAQRTLKRDLQRIALVSGDEDLQRQIEVVWPASAPPRALEQPELAKLVELQQRFNELTASLSRTLQDSLNELWRISQEEAAACAGTSGPRLLHKQGEWFVGFLQSLISGFWREKIGSTSTPIEQTLREMERKKPKNW